MKTSLFQLFSMLIAVSSLTTAAQALPPWKAQFKQMFVDEGPQSLQKAFADNALGSCKVCHVNLEKKTVRNPFGRALDELIEGNAAERLKAAAKDGEQAKRTMQKQIDLTIQ